MDLESASWRIKRKAEELENSQFEEQEKRYDDFLERKQKERNEFRKKFEDDYD